jgi:hypothetical protein
MRNTFLVTYDICHDKRLAMVQVVVHMIGIEEGDQQVHIEQSDEIHRASRSSFTRFIVGRGAPAGLLESTGTPFLTRAVRRGLSACRTKSDTTLSAVARGRRRAPSASSASATGRSAATRPESVIRRACASGLGARSVKRTRPATVPRSCADVAGNAAAADPCRSRCRSAYGRRRGCAAGWGRWDPWRTP